MAEGKVGVMALRRVGLMVDLMAARMAVSTVDLMADLTAAARVLPSAGMKDFWSVGELAGLKELVMAATMVVSSVDQMVVSMVAS